MPKKPPTTVVIENTLEKKELVHPNSCILKIGNSVSISPNIKPTTKTPIPNTKLDFNLTTL